MRPARDRALNMPYKNREDRLRTSKAWRLAHPKQARANVLRWEQNNRSKVHAFGAKYRASEKGKKRNREYEKRMRETDANVKIKCNLRTRLYAALKSAGAKRAANTMALVGCDLQFLRGYLEARFKDGMTWENYGKWHVDHKIPCAEFDLRDPDQQLVCFNYKNLQPLWGPDNQKKGAKRPASHQAELI